VAGGKEKYPKSRTHSSASARNQAASFLGGPSRKTLSFIRMSRAETIARRRSKLAAAYPDASYRWISIHSSLEISEISLPIGSSRKSSAPAFGRSKLRSSCLFIERNGHTHLFLLFFSGVVLPGRGNSVARFPHRNRAPLKNKRDLGEPRVSINRQPLTGLGNRYTPNLVVL